MSIQHALPFVTMLSLVTETQNKKYVPWVKDYHNQTSLFSGHCLSSPVPAVNVFNNQKTVNKVSLFKQECNFIYHPLGFSMSLTYGVKWLRASNDIF